MPDTMKKPVPVTLKTRVHPFHVPDSLAVENADTDFDLPSAGTESAILEAIRCPRIKISAIDAPTLSRMCDQFRTGVFRAAGKIEPDRAISDLEVAIEAIEDAVRFLSEPPVSDQTARMLEAKLVSTLKSIKGRRQ